MQIEPDQLALLDKADPDKLLAVAILAVMLTLDKLPTDEQRIDMVTAALDAHRDIHRVMLLEAITNKGELLKDAESMVQLRRKLYVTANKAFEAVNKSARRFFNMTEMLHD